MAVPLEKLVLTAGQEILGTADYQMVDYGGGDRHGAWEWMWRKSHGPRRVAVTISVAETDGESDACDIEVWAGCEERLRFGRVRIGEISRVRTSDTPGSAVWPQLITLVNAARKKAEDFGKDLPASYHTFDRPA
jgi:hypothetical protein